MRYFKRQLTKKLWNPKREKKKQPENTTEHQKVKRSSVERKRVVKIVIPSPGKIKTELWCMYKSQIYKQVNVNAAIADRRRERGVAGQGGGPLGVYICALRSEPEWL